MTDHRAKAAGIVVLDARTGEVLAMANLPSYNPNNRGKLDPRRMRNRAVTDLFEPGSTAAFNPPVALGSARCAGDDLQPRRVTDDLPPHPRRATHGALTLTSSP